MPRSRLARLAKKEEKATIKRIVYLSALSIILAVFLFTLGVPLLGKFADALDVVFKNKNDGTSADKTALQSPTLEDLPQATNSARLPVSGFSQDGVKVAVFLGEDKAGEAGIENGKFQYDGVSLKNGENKISAKAVSAQDKEGPASDVKVVILDTEPPKLEVNSPSEGQAFSGDNRVKVSGKTDRDAQVFAGGFLATIDIEGNFEVLVPLIEGDNTIEIKAIDMAGNLTVEKRKVNYHK